MVYRRSRARLEWLSLAVLLAMGGAASAITIDDFSEGAVTLVDPLGPGSAANLTTGLSAAHTFATARHITFNAIDPTPFGSTGSVTVKVDGANDGSLKLTPDSGLTAANFYVSYGSTSLGMPAMSLNLLADESDCIAFDFASTIPDGTKSSSQFFLEMFLVSGNGVGYNAYRRVPSSPTPFTFELPFSEILATKPTFDLANVKSFRFGTANGTMEGAFELTGVRTDLATGVAAGDFNGDGMVDAADYVVWRNGYPNAYSQSQLAPWRTNFGAVVGGGTSTSAVPEPAGVALFAVAALMVLSGRRKY
jgi:hypothetical protein